jgi:hypothetical protein
VPHATEPFHPLWISAAFLRGATCDGRRQQAGAAEFEALYLDCDWLDACALGEVLRLAQQGLPVVLVGRPRRPGRGEPGDYEAKLEALLALPNLHRAVSALGLMPLVEGEDLPPYWARRDGDELILFFAHPAARQVRYPMRCGQAREMPATTRSVRVNAGGHRHAVVLDFLPNQSILLRVSADRVAPIDSGYDPGAREETSHDPASGCSGGGPSGGPSRGVQRRFPRPGK